MSFSRDWIPPSPYREAPPSAKRERIGTLMDNPMMLVFGAMAAMLLLSVGLVIVLGIVTTKH
jgi:hypothetical protein